MRELYRKNVGVVVCKKGKVLLCARADSSAYNWQFPQGGIEKDENIVEAAKRELFEETGIKSIKLIKQMPCSIKYDFPINNKCHRIPGYKGQDQHWVCFEFLGDDDEINFETNPEEIEFKAFEWADISEAPKRIIEFKKDVYLRVAEFFKDYVKETVNE